MTNWVVRNSDGEFMVLDNGDPGLINTQPSNYTLVSVAGTSCPDPRTQRWDGTAVATKTAAQIAAFDAAVLAAKCQSFSTQKDTLATLAVIVRAKNTAAWNAMTTQQKVDATLAEAAVWSTIRVWLDDKV